MSPKSFPAPEPGDIVWCRFPQLEGIRPGPKARPALVLSVDDARTPARVRVAYGTSRRTHELAPWEFSISPDDVEAFRMAGLSQATKVSMLAVVILDYTSLWFAVAPGLPLRITPKMGVLHPNRVRHAQQAHEEAQRQLRPR